VIKGDAGEACNAIVESLHMTSYVFDKHLATKKTPKLQKIVIATSEKNLSLKN